MCLLLACVFALCVCAYVCGLRVALALTNVYDIHFRSNSLATMFVSWRMSTHEFIEIKYCQSLSSRRCIIDRKGRRALLNAYFCDEFPAWINHAHSPGREKTFGDARGWGPEWAASPPRLRFVSVLPCHLSLPISPRTSLRRWWRS